MVDYLKSTKEDLNNLKIDILSNSKKAESDKSLLPRYSINQSFFKTQAEKLDRDIRNFNNKGSFARNFQNFQELRLSRLIYYLEEANKKYESHLQKNENLSGNGTSQLCIVFDIIKNSRELITLLYLLKWLESIYLKDNPKRDIERKFFFKNPLINEKEKDFNPDCFNDSMLLEKFRCIPHDEDTKDYSRILERIVTKFRSGNMIEAQTFAEYNNLFNISSILYGGLPVNDFLFDDLSKIAKIDFDLFPSYMRNKEFENLIKKANVLKQKDFSNNSNNLRNEFKTDLKEGIYYENNIVGNPNWLSWLHSNNQLAENDTGESEKRNSINLSRKLQSFLSGNSKYFENINNFNPYDILYTRILKLFNAKLIKKYLATQKLELHFTDDPDLNEYIASYSELSLDKIILELQRMEIYKNQIVTNDFFLDVELEIIKAHLANNTFDKLVLLDFVYQKLSFYMIDDNLSEYLRNQFNNLIDKDSYDKYTVEQKEMVFNNYMYISIINYWKFAFLSQLGIYLIFDSVINPILLRTNVQFSDMRTSFILNSEEIIKGFFNRIIDIIIDEIVPEITVYLVSFRTNITTIIEDLVHLVDKISTKNQFDKVIKEIDVHFKPFTEIINNSLANRSKIYPLVNFFNINLYIFLLIL